MDERSAASIDSEPSAHLDDQLCFALYAASRAVTATYRPLLSKLGLTYPQYVTMLAIWENEGSTVRALGEALDLDSGTLSPVLSRLETEGLLLKKNDPNDERSVQVYSTAKGKALEQKVAAVRCAVEDATGLAESEFQALRSALKALTARLREG